MFRIWIHKLFTSCFLPLKISFLNITILQSAFLKLENRHAADFTSFTCFWIVIVIPFSRDLRNPILLHYTQPRLRRWLSMLRTMTLWSLLSTVCLTEALGRIRIVFILFRQFIPLFYFHWLLISFKHSKFLFLLCQFVFQLTDFS